MNITRQGSWARRAWLLGWVALAAVLTVVLAGCSTVSHVAPIAAEQKLTGKEGAVVLKLITNGRSLWDPADTLSAIQIKREALPASAGASAPSGPSEIFSLTRTRDFTQTTAVFSGMVAPGRYTVLNAIGSQGNTTYTFLIGSMLSSFEVAPNEVSLVGTLLLQPFEDRRFVVSYLPPDDELRATFESLFPALAEQTRGRPVHTLEMTPDLRKRADLAPLFKRISGGLSGVHLTEQGEGFVGRKMGKALWRPAGERRWRDLDVGSWKQVLSLRAYRGGLLAAGEEGLLRHSADGGRTWTTLTPPEFGVIALAEPLPSGKVMALVKHQSQWNAFVSDDPLAGAWRKVASFADERSLNVPWQAAATVSLGGKVGVMMPNGYLQVVDGETGQVERRNSGLSLLSLSRTPDGMLVMQGAIVVRTTLVSTDDGKTWKDLDTSRFVAAIAFADRQKAYAVAPIKPGVFPGAYALMASRDGARTWVQTGEVPGGAPENVLELMVDRSDGALLAFLRNGRILRSTDEGAHWSNDV